MTNPVNFMFALQDRPIKSPNAIIGKSIKVENKMRNESTVIINDVE